MKLLSRKILLIPFYLLTLAVDMAGMVSRRFLIRNQSPRPKLCVTGISVVIPERNNQEMLRRCLHSVRAACACVTEPTQVIVVVSEARPDMYEDLTEEFQVQWIFESEPLWFIEAVSLGVGAAKYGWVYLLNSDMVVDTAALVEVAKWRSASVFAIASQIYFQDSTRRREETGFTEIRNAGDLIEIADMTPCDDEGVRTHAYAGGGSSLFQRDLLASFLDGTKVYAPFYWEDVEWGVLAWRHGYEVLFCPRSKVWHAHRSTNLKFFSREEIDRIFMRNRLRFQLRTALPPNALRTVFGTIARLDARSFREMVNVRWFADTLRSRFQSHFHRPFSLRPIPEVGVHYRRPRRSGCPLIMIVSPYCVYPPTHGGARRIHELIHRLAEKFDIILLSDESEHYSSASLEYFWKCHLVCLVRGRKAHPDFGRINRILTHSNRTLASHVQMLIATHEPDIVQIEYIELAKLVELRDGRPWILTLHDVLLDEGGLKNQKEDEFELQYINRFDAVIVCSPEDRVLLARDDVYVVHNGAHPTTEYTPSPRDGPILFVGPFRYAPNLEGITEFLNDIYPSVRAQLRMAQLWILGGVGSHAIAARNTCFDQPGVTVFDFVDDVQYYLQSCAISINPDKGGRGSSLKVIESLMAGRVCISTRDGARGYMASDLPSLVIADKKDFADRIAGLLTDVQHRHSLECPTEALNQYSWQRASEEQARIYNSLLQTGCSTPKSVSARARTLAG